LEDPAYRTAYMILNNFPARLRDDVPGALAGVLNEPATRNPQLSSANNLQNVINFP